MQKVNARKLYRIIDANFNRAKEGLRVCEDTCRFILDQKELTRQYRAIRHNLTGIVTALGINGIITSRDIKNDIGKQSTALELKRKNIADIYYANSQRVKESVRVLEEFTKLVDRRSARAVKRMRYKLYALEKTITKKL